MERLQTLLYGPGSSLATSSEVLHYFFDKLAQPRLLPRQIALKVCSLNAIVGFCILCFLAEFGFSYCMQNGCPVSNKFLLLIGSFCLVVFCVRVFIAGEICDQKL